MTWIQNFCTISEFYPFYPYFHIWTMDLGTNLIWQHWNWAQFQFGTLELGTIQFRVIGLRHSLDWQHWNKAQFQLGTLE